MLITNLDENNSKPDVILLCETWLSSLNYDLFSIVGYNFVDNHRFHAKCGGVAIYIRKGIGYKMRDDLTVFFSLSLLS
jgi:exonuclease III